jgi:hypothetical protein
LKEKRGKRGSEEAPGELTTFLAEEGTGHCLRGGGIEEYVKIEGLPKNILPP